MEEGRDGPGGPCMWVSPLQDTGPTFAAGIASRCLLAGRDRMDVRRGWGRRLAHTRCPQWSGHPVLSASHAGLLADLR